MTVAMWKPEEDELIEEGVRRFGLKWRKVASALPGRTDSSVRNRWQRLQKEREERRKNPPPGKPPLWRVRAGRMLASGPGSCWQSESEMMWPSHSRDRQPGTWCYCDARTTVYSITFEADGVHWRTCIYAREQ